VDFDNIHCQQHQSRSKLAYSWVAGISSNTESLPLFSVTAHVVVSVVAACMRWSLMLSIAAVRKKDFLTSLEQKCGISNLVA